MVMKLCATAAQANGRKCDDEMGMVGREEGLKDQPSHMGCQHSVPSIRFAKRKTFEDEHKRGDSNPRRLACEPGEESDDDVLEPMGHRPPKPTKSLTNDHAGSVSGSFASSNDGVRPASVHFLF